MAAKLQCEICGGKLIGRPGGVFECDSCGMEYDTAWAKAKIQEITGTVKVEGTVEVTGKVQVDGPVKVEGGVNKEALLQRGRLALEECEWAKAKEFFDQALTLDAEFAEAWLGLVMADFGFKTESGFGKPRLGRKQITDNANYKKFLRFAEPKRRREIQSKVDGAREKVRKAQLDREAEDTARKEAFRSEQPSLRARIAPAQGMLAAGNWFTLGLKADGTVLYAGEKPDLRKAVSGWKGIIAVSAGDYHALGLKSDGTVVAAGENQHTITKHFSDGSLMGKWKEITIKDGRCNVSEWRHIVAIAAGRLHSVGLRSDGTVVAVGENERGQCNVSEWKDIVAIAAGEDRTVGLKADGTVVAVGSSWYNTCKVSRWKNIVAVDANWSFTFGLKSDGSMEATGPDSNSQRFITEDRDLIDISAGGRHTVGLKGDGTLTASGDRDDGRCNFSSWKGIIAIAAGAAHTVGLKPDGTVVAVGSNQSHECDVSDWKLFDSLETLPAERRAAQEKAEAERKAKIASLEAEQAALNEELANLRGLFTGKRRKEIEARLGEISSELKKLG